jgi:tetratricopeptide (TPR) repeat protein
MADLAAANARRATAATGEQLAPWVELAQALVQDEQPEAAARALRARLRASTNPLSDELAAALATVTFAADAASPDMVDQSAELARELDRRGALRQLSGVQPPATYGEALFEVSSMYTLVGNREGAARLLAEVLAQQPDHAMAGNNLGYARIVAGHDDEETVQMIEHAWELMPDDPNILDTLGWLRYRQGRFVDETNPPQGAKSLLQASLDANAANAEVPNPTPSPEVLEHLGDVNWRLGDREGAVAAWKRAVAVLEDRPFEERILQNYLMVQTRVWGLLVADPREMYDREFGQLLRRVQSKLQAVEQNREPSVTSTFAEEHAAEVQP